MREYTHDTRPRTPTSATASRPPCSPPTTSRPSTRTSCGCSRTACDTAALQRFNPNGSEGPTRDAMAVKVRSAAEANGRKFYIMYDVTGWTNMQPEIKTDWTSKMSAHTASSAYARPERQAGGVHLGLRLQRQQPSLGRRRLPGRGQLVQGPGLLRDRRRAAGVAHRHRRLTRRLPGRLPRLQHALPLDGRRDRHRRGLRLRLPELQRSRPGRLQRQRHRLPALRAARGRLGPAAGPRRLHVAPVLQHGPRRRPGHLHLHVRRVQRGQPDRQDRRSRRHRYPPTPGCSPWTRTAPPAPPTTTCG